MTFEEFVRQRMGGVMNSTPGPYVPPSVNRIPVPTSQYATVPAPRQDFEAMRMGQHPNATQLYNAKFNEDFNNRFNTDFNNRYLNGQRIAQQMRDSETPGPMIPEDPNDPITIKYRTFLDAGMSPNQAAVLARTPDRMMPDQRGGKIATDPVGAVEDVGGSAILGAAGLVGSGLDAAGTPGKTLKDVGGFVFKTALPWPANKNLKSLGNDAYRQSQDPSDAAWNPYYYVDTGIEDWAKDPANKDRIKTAHELGIDLNGDGTMDINGGDAVMLLYNADNPQGFISSIVSQTALDPLFLSMFVAPTVGAAREGAAAATEINAATEGVNASGLTLRQAVVASINKSLLKGMEATDPLLSGVEKMADVVNKVANAPVDYPIKAAGWALGKTGWGRWAMTPTARTAKATAEREAEDAFYGANRAGAPRPETPPEDINVRPPEETAPVPEQPIVESTSQLQEPVAASVETPTIPPMAAPLEFTPGARERMGQYPGMGPTRPTKTWDSVLERAMQTGKIDEGEQVIRDALANRRGPEASVRKLTDGRVSSWREWFQNEERLAGVSPKTTDIPPDIAATNRSAGEPPVTDELTRNQLNDQIAQGQRTSTQGLATGVPEGRGVVQGTMRLIDRVEALKNEFRGKYNAFTREHANALAWHSKKQAALSADKNAFPTMAEKLANEAANATAYTVNKLAPTYIKHFGELGGLPDLPVTKQSVGQAYSHETFENPDRVIETYVYQANDIEAARIMRELENRTDLGKSKNKVLKQVKSNREKLQNLRVKAEKVTKNPEAAARAEEAIATAQQTIPTPHQPETRSLDELVAAGEMDPKTADYMRQEVTISPEPKQSKAMGKEVQTFGDTVRVVERPEGWVVQKKLSPTEPRTSTVRGASTSNTLETGRNVGTDVSGKTTTTPTDTGSITERQTTTRRVTTPGERVKTEKGQPTVRTTVVRGKTIRTRTPRGWENVNVHSTKSAAMEEADKLATKTSTAWEQFQETLAKHKKMASFNEHAAMTEFANRMVEGTGKGIPYAKKMLLRRAAGRYQKEYRQIVQFNSATGLRGVSTDFATDMSRMTMEGHGEAALKSGALDVYRRLRGGPDAYQATMDAFGERIPQGMHVDHGRTDVDIRMGDRTSTHTGASNILRVSEGTGADKAIGVATGTINSRWIQNLRGVADEVKRRAVALSEIEKRLPQAMRDFTAEGHEWAARNNIESASFDAYIGELGGRFSAADVRAAMEELGIDSGMTREQAEKAAIHPMRRWQHQINQMVEASRKEVNRVLLSYERTNLDESLGRFVFFNYWMSRSLPAYVKIALRNPAIAAFWVRTWNEIHKKAVADHLPKSIMHMIRFYQSEAGFSYFLGGPLSTLMPFDQFRADNPQDATAFDKISNYVFFAPIIREAAAAIGMSKDTPDPTGLYSIRGLWGTLINATKQHTGHEGVGDMPYMNALNRLYGWTSKIADNVGIPGSHKRLIQDQTANTVTNIRWGIADIIAKKQGISVDEAMKTDEYLQASTALSTEDPLVNPIAKEATTQYYDALAIGKGMTGVTPGGVQTRVTSKDENMYVRQESTSPRTPEEKAAFNSYARSTDSPQVITLSDQQDKYHQLGTDRQQQIAKEWNVLAYGSVGDLGEEIGSNETIVIGDNRWSGAEWGKLSQDARRSWADKWVATLGDTSTAELANYLAQQEAFKTANPEYKGYSDWTSQAHSGGDEAAMIAYWRSGNTEYDNYLKDQEKQGRSATSVGLTLDAYIHYMGMKPKMNSPEPASINDPSRVPFGTQPPGGSGFGSGSSTAKTPKERLQNSIDDYTAKMEQIGQWLPKDIALDDMAPMNRSAYIDALAKQGITVPDMPSTVKSYYDWKAVQPSGSDTSIDAYLIWLDSWKGKVDMAPAA